MTAEDLQMTPESPFTNRKSNRYSNGTSNDTNNSSEGPRKKQRMNSSSGADGSAPRPMCTNCEQCQLRKGKCDGGRPICGWCAANNKQCVYQEKKKPGLKAGYGRDLERRLTTLEENLGGREAELERKVAMLEGKVERWEGILREVQGQVATVGGGRNGGSVYGGGDGGMPGLGAMGAPSPAGSIHPSHHSHHSHHSGASMPVQSPYQAQPQMAGPGPTAPTAMFASPTASSQMSIHNLNGYKPPARPGSITSHASLHRSQSSQHPNPLPTLSPAIPPGPGSKFVDPDLPPFDLSVDMLELYFDRINIWFPLLDRKSTFNKILRARDQEPEDEILLHAIIATTLRYLDPYDPRYAQHRKHYYEKSRNKVLLHAFEASSIRGLQALVILALDMVGAQNGGPGMFLLAAIIRCATQLGLTSETFSLSMSPDYPSISTLRASVLPEPKDFIEDEMRRRLFWSIYLLDRDTTVATAFDFVLDQSTIDRKLPCKDDLFSANQPVETRWFNTSKRTDYSVDCPANLGTFSYLIELKGLLTKIHQFLKRPVNINAHADVDQWRRTYRDIDCLLRNWRSNLPFELRNTDQILTLGDGGHTMTCGWILLQVTYYTVFIRMHSSAAYPPYRTPIFTPSYSAAQQCYLAVEKIVSLTKYVISSNMLSQQGPPFAFSLWVSARVLLVHGSTVEKHVSGEIHFLIQTLQQLGVYWPVAARYAEILTRVMGEYTESQSRLGGRNANGAGTAADGIAPQPPSVAILADMRRCAYELDTLISNEPIVRQASRNTHATGNSGMATLGNGLRAGGNHHGMTSSSSGAGGGEVGGGSGGANAPMLTEMDYLETFNFFNYPKMGPGDGGMDVGVGAAGFNAYYSVPSDAASQASMNGFAVPDISSDWLSTHFT